MILTLLALPSFFREERNPSLWFSYRLSWLSPNLLASTGSVNVTFVEMTTPKSTGICVFVSQGMSFYTVWKVSSAFNGMTTKPVREGRKCHAPLECFTVISSKQRFPLQRPQCLCPLEDDLVENLTGKFLPSPFFPFPFSQQPLNLWGKRKTLFGMIYSVTGKTPSLCSYHYHFLCSIYEKNPHKQFLITPKQEYLYRIIEWFGDIGVMDRVNLFLF